MFPNSVRLAAFVSLFAAGAGASSAPIVQVARSTDTPLRAIGADAARRQANPPDAQTSYYANVLPAQSGDAGIDHIDSMPGYKFTAIRVVTSVAPAVYAGIQDISGGQTSGALGALRHLSVHITVKPIDASGQVIDVSRSASLVLATLEISPSEPVFSDRTTNTEAAISTAVSQIASTIKPAAAALQAFQASYHRKPSPTQVAYMTGPNSFGWRWYESPGNTIEGLHHTTALLQVAESLKTLRLTVELVADWRAFGVWAKSFEFTYTLPAGPS